MKTAADEPDLGLGTEPLMLVVLGPTGSGKSALAVELALRFRGEILSCDSVAVYRGLEVGAAKPSAAQRALVPHHLLDLLNPTEAMTAGDWARTARVAAREVAGRGRLPIVCGGTGLYLRALLDGLDPLPPRCPALRERLAASARRRPAGYLHRLLLRLDGGAAARIHPNDEPKLMRALELALLGAPAAGRREALRGFRLLRLGLEPPREALYARLNRRAVEMFAGGLLEETRALQTRYGAEAQALRALGYREAAAVLAGTLGEAEAVAAVQQGHRNYAKRQLTWFRREPDVHWLHGFGGEPGIAAKAAALVSGALSGGLARPGKDNPPNS